MCGLDESIVLRNLIDCEKYLAQFHQCLQSAHFDKLIAEAFSCILHLPFFTLDNEDERKPHRVTWQGRTNHLFGF